MVYEGEVALVCFAGFLQGGFAVFGVKAEDEVGEAVVDSQIPSDISTLRQNSLEYVLQVPRSQILQSFVRTKERESVCELEAVFVGRDGGGKVLLVGGGVAVPRSLDILPLQLSRAEE